MSSVERPTWEKARATAVSALSAGRLRRGRLGPRFLHGLRHRAARKGAQISEGGVEVVGDLGRREPALLEHGRDRLGRLEERVRIAAAAEDLAVHVPGL